MYTTSYKLLIAGDKLLFGMRWKHFETGFGPYILHLFHLRLPAVSNSEHKK